MNLSAPFIQRPIMTTLAMLALLVAGLLAYAHLPISSMPNVTYPVISVKVSFPGALPETMASAISLPLEKQFMTIPGLRLVSSSNTLGVTTIVLQFEIQKDSLTAAQDVQEAITAATPYLPPDLPFGPTYRKINPSELPIIYLALTSKTLSRSELYTYGNTIIGQRISMVEGVSQVTTYGSPLAIRLQMDPVRLAAHAITLNEVAQAIQAENALLPTGILNGPLSAPLISVEGQLLTAEAYESVILTYRNGVPIRLQDVGRSIANFSNNKTYPQFADATLQEGAVILAVQKEPSANAVAISEEIDQLLEKIKIELPPAVDLHVFFDRSIPVKLAIKDTIYTLCLSLILVILVIFFFLGKITDTIIPSLILPLSIIATFIVMYILHFTLDNLSVLALTLAIGFIIDDAVVVLENIVRKVEQGQLPYLAALEGSKQICFTIVSMSLSLIAVFIPMLFMAGLVGEILREFAITLTIITFISGFISLTLTPMLASRFILARKKSSTKGSFAKSIENFHRSLENRYGKLLAAVLPHRFMATTIAILCSLLTIALFSYLPIDFVPDEDLGFFLVFTQAKEGGSSYKMLDYQNQLLKLLQNHPAVDKVVSISSYSQYRKGLNLVRLKPLEKREPIQKVIKEIQKGISDIVGLQGFIKNIPLIDLATGAESRAAYQFALQNISPAKLYPAAQKLLAQMRKDPLFQSVNSDLEVDTPQINVTILRDQAARLGIDATAIESAFSYSFSGNFISRIQTAIDQYYVILELYPEYQRQAAILNNVWLRSSLSNSLVPLSAVLNWKEGLGASSINHINQFPSVTVSFNLAAEVPLEKALNRLKTFTQELNDQGITSRPIGAAQTFNESIKSTGFLLLITLFCIYIILGILYESFIHPLTILTTLPPATCGGLLTLLLFGLPLSLYSFLGIILLIGIVKKNGIMMIDFAIENRRYQQMSPYDAILNACLKRFRPIMMTTVAAIFGVLPIALGLGSNAQARRPLGLVIIGGLLLSQLITLFVTPILYLAMENINEKISLRSVS